MQLVEQVMEQVEEMQLVEQVGEVHQQPKQEVEEMRWISPAEAEGIVQPKKEGEEIYTFEVDDQNNLELLNPEQQDMVQNALQENGIDFSTISMEDTFTFEDSFVPPASASATTESFIDSTPASSATIEDLLNVGAAQDDDPDWMPEEELLQPSTSRARRPSCARKPAIRSVQKTSMKKKKPGRPEREGPYNIPSIPTRNARMGMSGGAPGTEVPKDARAEQPGEQGLPRQEEEQAAGHGGGAGGGAGEEPEAQAAA